MGGPPEGGGRRRRAALPRVLRGDTLERGGGGIVRLGMSRAGAAGGITLCGILIGISGCSFPADDLNCHDPVDSASRQRNTDYTTSFKTKRHDYESTMTLFYSSSAPVWAMPV